MLNKYQEITPKNIVLTNFLFKMSAATDTEELWTLLLKGMDIYGLDRLLNGFSRFTTGTRVDDRNVLGSY